MQDFENIRNTEEFDDYMRYETQEQRIARYNILQHDISIMILKAEIQQGILKPGQPELKRQLKAFRRLQARSLLSRYAQRELAILQLLLQG
ncbi:MAG TPA: hypothetical protein VKR06_03275 [Ktedonosporobacter sp.]|nr:hypothetical protein [Ktedonosporobacter sp.]